MTMKRVIGAMAGGVMVAVAGVAVAANFTSSKQADFYASGNHQFYVWCAGGTDYVATAKGASAEAAQTRLYNANKAHGKATCWPVWQGRVSG
jgi:heme exporter protein D